MEHCEEILCLSCDARIASPISLPGFAFIVLGATLNLWFYSNLLIIFVILIIFDVIIINSPPVRNEVIVIIIATLPLLSPPLFWRGWLKEILVLVAC